ncbi:substrate-binding domain-containing protein [Paraburkholderia phymatum]|uniref:substrate-binding domain-containing protein n=1 Tax=Paraburkholderia phymatum TaxID=148447 RepID=UPI00316DD641
MAMRDVLAQLAQEYAGTTGQHVEIESVGGVTAARRVESGEAFDIVVLAADAIDRLDTAGRIVSGSRVELARSGVAVAVAAGKPRPSIGSEAELRDAILSARSIGYSTGPSGAHLIQLFERWGITRDIQERIVQAPTGVPVGALVARGEVELGFQQLSELWNQPGIDVIGPLPDEIQVITVFSAAICATCTRLVAARALLSFLTSREAEFAKRAHGMAPA